MNKRQNKMFGKTEQLQPKKKVRIEVYDDGQYVGTITTDFHWDNEHPIDEETLLEYVHKKMPTRKKKYLSVKIV